MTTPTLTRRERLRAQTRVEILLHARKQVTDTGELSLREIARGMGITSPALYHYFPAVGAIQDVIAKEIVLAATLAISSWPDYVEWTVDNPHRFAFLAKHPALLAQLHAAVAAADAQAGAA